MSQSQNINKIERGREAGLMEATIRPYVDERIRQVINRIVAMYRGNKVTHDQLVGCIAEVSALQGLLDDLENVQRQGVVAADKEMGNGQN